MTSDKVPHVFTAISEVQTELAKIGIDKEGVNASQKFNFRGIDQVLTTLSGLMANARMRLSTRIHSVVESERPTRNGGVMYRTLITMEVTAVSLVDGSPAAFGTFIGEAADSGDKAASKATSIAFKYACFIGFCIPLEGVLEDPDATTNEPSAPRAKAPAKAPAPTEEPAPKAKAKAKADNGMFEAAQKAVQEAGSVDDLKAARKAVAALTTHDQYDELKGVFAVKFAELTTK